VKHPSEVLKKGDRVKAVILAIEPDKRRLSLGVKQLQPDAWETFFRSHAIGDLVRGRPSRAVAFGVFVELLPGVEGLCHNSEIPAELREQNPPLPIGEEMTFKVIKLNEAEKRIGLTMVSAAAEQERLRMDEYQRRAEEASHGIGEAAHAAEAGSSEAGSPEVASPEAESAAAGSTESDDGNAE
jgi:small subunit ribosomal protein S1